ncbi:MAG: bifunctional nuclease family protein [Patescibacteria group bacterium]
MNKVRLRVFDFFSTTEEPSSESDFVIILKEIGAKRYIEIITDDFQGDALIVAVKKVETRQPLTHHLIKKIIKHYHEKITEVVITDCVDDVYYAYLKIGLFEFDCRPSDAIALSFYFNAPIFALETLMRKVSFNREGQNFLPENKDVPQAVKSKITKFEELQMKLNEAVRLENYEKAAKIRDEIKNLRVID